MGGGRSNPISIENLYGDIDDILESTQCIPTNCATGSDGLASKMLKKAKDPNTKMILSIVRASIKSGKYPSELSLCE